MNPFRPAKIERDAARVRARRHDKVIFQLPLVAVVNQVNGGINSLVLHLRVGWHVRSPLPRIVAEEVVALAGQFIQTSNLGCRIGPAESHPQHAAGFGRSYFGPRRESDTSDLRLIRVRLIAAQCEHGFIPGEEKRVSTGARQKLYPRIGLSLILLEAQRQLAIALENLGLGFRVGMEYTD